MANRKVNPKRKTLRMKIAPGPRKRGTCLQLPTEINATVNQTQMLIDGLLGVTPALSIVVARALEVYLLKLVDLLMDASDPTTTATIKTQMALTCKLEAERHALFESAGRSRDYWDVGLGRLPDLESLTGNAAGFDKAEMVREIKSRLGNLLPSQELGAKNA